MVWFSFAQARLNREEIKKNILEQEVPFPQRIRHALEPLDFVEAWELLKELLPVLEKTKARDLVRILLGDKLHLVGNLLEERTERLLALECLGYLPSAQSIELLVKYLSHGDDYVQLVAAGALKNHTPRLVVPMLQEVLLQGAASPARVGEVLLAMGYLADEGLLAIYSEASPPVKGQIIEILTLSGNPKCEILLEEALQGDNTQLKLQALEAVAYFSFCQLWLHVALCLTEPPWTLRAKALEVLGKLGVAEAREYVAPFLADEDPWVRECAEECMKILDKRRKEGEWAHAL